MPAPLRVIVFKLYFSFADTIFHLFNETRCPYSCGLSNLRTNLLVLTLSQDSSVSCSIEELLERYASTVRCAKTVSSDPGRQERLMDSSVRCSSLMAAHYHMPPRGRLGKQLQCCSSVSHISMEEFVLVIR